MAPITPPNAPLLVVKERYRTMRGYKRERSALNVSRLIAYCGNHLAEGLNLATFVT